jgi:hypothetical protein
MTERFYIYRQVAYSDYLYHLYSETAFSSLANAKIWLYNLPAETRNGQMFLIKGMRFVTPAELILAPGYKAGQAELLERF